MKNTAQVLLPLVFTVLAEGSPTQLDSKWQVDFSVGTTFHKFPSNETPILQVHTIHIPPGGQAEYSHKQVPINNADIPFTFLENFTTLDGSPFSQPLSPSAFSFVQSLIPPEILKDINFPIQNAPKTSETLKPMTDDQNFHLKPTPTQVLTSSSQLVPMPAEQTQGRPITIPPPPKLKDPSNYGQVSFAYKPPEVITGFSADHIKKYSRTSPDRDAQSNSVQSQNTPSIVVVSSPTELQDKPPPIPAPTSRDTFGSNQTFANNPSGFGPSKPTKNTLSTETLPNSQFVPMPAEQIQDRPPPIPSAPRVTSGSLPSFAYNITTTQPTKNTSSTHILPNSQFVPMPAGQIPYRPPPIPAAPRVMLDRPSFAAPTTTHRTLPVQSTNESVSIIIVSNSSQFMPIPANQTGSRRPQLSSPPYHKYEEESSDEYSNVFHAGHDKHNYPHKSPDRKFDNSSPHNYYDHDHGYYSGEEYESDDEDHDHEPDHGEHMLDVRTHPDMRT